MERERARERARKTHDTHEHAHGTHRHDTVEMRLHDTRTQHTRTIHTCTTHTRHTHTTKAHGTHTKDIHSHATDTHAWNLGFGHCSHICVTCSSMRVTQKRTLKSTRDFCYITVGCVGGRGGGCYHRKYVSHHMNFDVFIHNHGVRSAQGGGGYYCGLLQKKQRENKMNASIILYVRCEKKD